ncbi:hypothetical protein Mccp14020TZ_04430 [Mycoplasma capricolum subsp. capripneumoniae]|nr:hypothetical protein BVA24_01975 [Mycoplasma capricolum subsp. capripneumoniae]WGD32935.1 hypothetical protein Mccp14020TZ_04430 [Mycoplasma capricolum subsp. capripneumoniae]
MVKSNTFKISLVNSSKSVVPNPNNLNISLNKEIDSFLVLEFSSIFESKTFLVLYESFSKYWFKRFSNVFILLILLSVFSSVKLFF